MLRDRFVLPDVTTVASVPPREVPAKILQCAALSQALAGRLGQQQVGNGDDASDVVSAAEVMRLLHCGPRWLRSATCRRLRRKEKIGGRVVFSRRKIAAFMQGEIGEDE